MKISQHFSVSQIPSNLKLYGSDVRIVYSIFQYMYLSIKRFSSTDIPRFVRSRTRDLSRTARHNIYKPWIDLTTDLHESGEICTTLSEHILIDTMLNMLNQRRN